MAGDQQQMPRLDLNKDLPKLSDAQKYYMKYVEKENMERVRKLAKTRKSNILTGALLATGVFSIYFYSMFAVKQEKFLDEID